MKKMLRLCGALLGIASISYFLVFAHRTLVRHDLQAIWSPRMMGAMALAAVGYASVIPTSSWAWGRLLRSMGAPSRTLQLNMIMGMTQIAKYLPGNVGQHLGRTAMSLRRGMPLDALLVTLAAEVLLAVAAATVVGVLGLALHHRAALPWLDLPRMALLVVLVPALCAGALLAAIRGIPWIMRRTVPRLGGTQLDQAPRVTALSAAFAAYASSYVIIGAGLFAIASAAVRPPLETLPLFIGALSLAWIAGFVVPGAPAGLGVREGAMAALLAPTLPGSSAFNVIVAFRIATTLGDVLALAWGGAIYLVELRRERRVGSAR